MKSSFRYLADDLFRTLYDKEGVRFTTVKTPTGTGKTEQMLKFIDKMKFGKVLIVAPYNAIHYNIMKRAPHVKTHVNPTAKRFEIEGDGIFSITPQRIASIPPDWVPDVVFFDEMHTIIEGFRSTFYYSKRAPGLSYRIITKLRSFYDSGHTKFFGLDANAILETSRLFADVVIGASGDAFTFYESDIDDIIGTLTIHNGPGLTRKNALIEVITAVEQKVQAGANFIAVACDSKRDALVVRDQLTMRGVSTLAVYAADEMTDEEEGETIDAALENIDEATEHTNVLIYNEKLGAGYSIDRPCDAMYAVIQGTIITGDAIQQLVARVRNVDHIDCFVYRNSKNFSMTPEARADEALTDWFASCAAVMGELMKDGKTEEAIEVARWAGNKIHAQMADFMVQCDIHIMKEFDDVPMSMAEYFKANRRDVELVEFYTTVDDELETLVSDNRRQEAYTLYEQMCKKELLHTDMTDKQKALISIIDDGISAVIGVHAWEAMITKGDDLSMVKLWRDKALDAIGIAYDVRMVPIEQVEARYTDDIVGKVLMKDKPRAHIKLIRALKKLVSHFDFEMAIKFKMVDVDRITIESDVRRELAGVLSQTIAYVPDESYLLKRGLKTMGIHTRTAKVDGDTMLIIDEGSSTAIINAVDLIHKSKSDGPRLLVG